MSFVQKAHYTLAGTEDLWYSKHLWDLPEIHSFLIIQVILSYPLHIFFAFLTLQLRLNEIWTE